MALSHSPLLVDPGCLFFCTARINCRPPCAAQTYGALCDNWPTLEPYFNETGSNMPSTLPRRQQRELIDMAVRSTQALGFEAVRCARWLRALQRCHWRCAVIRRARLTILLCV